MSKDQAEATDERDGKGGAGSRAGAGSPRRCGARARLAPRALLAVALVAAVVRFGALELAPPRALIGDEGYYLRTAVHLARGNGHGAGGEPHARWPPAQSWVLSLFVDPELARERLTHPALVLRLLRVEAALGTALAVLVAVLAAALFDGRTGLLSGLAAALYPTFVAYSHYLWSETLFLVLLVAALAASVRAGRGLGPEVGGPAGEDVGARPGRPWAAVAAGALFGAAGLTREIALPLAVAVAAWLVATASAGRRRRALGRAALVVGTAALVVLPWTARNAVHLGRFVPVSTVGWMGICEGNLLPRDAWWRVDAAELRAFRARYLSLEEGQRTEYARDLALERIRAEQPTWLAKKLVRNTALLFAPDSFLFKKMSQGCYDTLPAGVRRAAIAATVLAYVAVVVLGVVGIAADRDRRRRLLALAVAAVVVGLHVWAQAGSRYRLPLLPVLLVFGAHAARSGPARLAGLDRRARVAVVLCLAVFCGWCIPYVAGDLASLWTRGTYVEPLRP